MSCQDHSHDVIVSIVREPHRRDLHGAATPSLHVVYDTGVAPKYRRGWPPPRC
jgi:hypothetical protein